MCKIWRLISVFLRLASWYCVMEAIRSIPCKEGVKGRWRSKGLALKRNAATSSKDRFVVIVVVVAAVVSIPGTCSWQKSEQPVVDFHPRNQPDGMAVEILLLSCVVVRHRAFRSLVPPNHTEYFAISKLRGFSYRHSLR